MAINVLKLSDPEVVVKVAGNSGSDTIALKTTLLTPTQAIIEGTDQHAVITGIQYTGEAAGTISIVRDSVVIMTLSTAAAGFIDMSGQNMIPDNVKSNHDIVVTYTGQVEVWLRIKKTAGYQSKVELTQYGSYDDPSIVGASTTLSGSPDKEE